MRRLLALTAVFSLLATACVWQGGEETTTTISEATTTTAEPPPPTLPPELETAATAAVLSFLQAWGSGDLEAVRRLSPDAPDDLERLHADWRQDLEIESASYAVFDAIAAGDQAEVTYRADLRLVGAGGWSYEGTIRAVPDEGAWVIPWSASLIHPSMDESDRLLLARVWPTRAPILGTMGTTLVTDRAVKVIGVIPEQITDLDALLVELESLADIPPSIVVAELERPAVRPNWWLPVGWLPVIDYLPIQSALEEVDGVEIRDDTARLPPASPFADHVLGTTGPITAELLEQFGEPYRAGDIVGLSGLELAMESTLAGYPTFEVRRVNQFGRIAEVLHTVPGVPSTAVRTTLSVAVQLAAEAAVDGRPAAEGESDPAVPAEAQPGTGDPATETTAPSGTRPDPTDPSVALPAAVVVIDAATGEVRAIASRPLDGFDRALGGTYPPGSTFKVVTASALLSDGVRPEDPVECPAEVLVGGRPFRNAGDRDLGQIPFTTSFTESCNTTFAALAPARLGLEGLDEAAADFGFGTSYQIGLPTAGASYAETAEAADVAAAAIGQGAVRVTPLHQATVAAAVAGGAWRRPTLVERPSESEAVPLDPAVIADLTEMMRLVVEEGTGTGAAVEGEDVYGKTGSAEYAAGEPTHAWFLGFWNGLGFAVLVEGGGAGGAAAAPIAADLVAALAD